MLATLAAGLEVCRASMADNSPLLGAMFLMGLVGSLSHCLFMCGPFVLSQTAARYGAIPLSQMTEFRRLSGAVLLPYHLGRATTYAGLGAVMGWVVGGTLAFGVFKYVAAGLLVFAALFLIAMALPAIRRFFSPNGGENWWSSHISGLAKPLFASPFGFKGWLLGVALGFLPCGLLYAALASAASAGEPLGAAFSMLAFSLGTIPALIAVGAVGHFAVQHFRAGILKFAPLLLILNALVLIFMALKMITRV